jgi:hypothetical protein
MTEEKEEVGKEEDGEKVAKQSNTGKIIPGVILIVLGILFLLPKLGINFGNLWPLFILAPGLAFLTFCYFSPDKQKQAGILIPGTILTLISIFFLYMNYAGWEKSDKLWPVYPLIVSIAFYLTYLGGGRKDKGLLVPANILGVVAVLFLIFGAVSFNLWPLILIIVGLFIILKKNSEGDRK